jgi:hypothetical protein
MLRGQYLYCCNYHNVKGKIFVIVVITMHVKGNIFYIVVIIVHVKGEE